MTALYRFSLKRGEDELSFHCFDNPLGKLVTQEILSGKTYRLPKGLPPIRTIVDVGANIGAAAFFFAQAAPQARIYAFEPQSLCHALFRQNLAPFPQVNLFPYGLWHQDAEMTLHAGHTDPATASLGQSALNSQGGQVVRLRQAGPVMAELGLAAIDLLKIDTEGAEVPILEALKALLPATRLIYVEYHSEADRRSIDRLLAPTHDLHSGRIIRPHQGELLYVERKCLAALGADSLAIRPQG